MFGRLLFAPRRKVLHFDYPVAPNQTGAPDEATSAGDATKKLAVCAVFKDEGAYLDEWVRFHRSQGVEHFFLYNNFSSDDYLRVLAPHADYVTVTDWPVSFLEGGQLRAMVHAIEQPGASYRWLAIIDIDEFIFGVTRPLVEELALEPYVHADQILVNTICYGTSGISEYPAGTLLKHLTRRAPLWWRRNSQRKCIVNPRAVERVNLIHEMQVRLGSVNATGSGKIVAPTNSRKHPRFVGSVRKLRRDISRLVFRVPILVKIIPATLMLFLMPYEGGNHTFYDGVARIRINHYVIRSKSQFWEKLERFKGTHFQSKIDESFLKYHDQNQIDDPVLAHWDTKGVYLSEGPPKTE
jgi:hypothetical protein